MEHTLWAGALALALPLAGAAQEAGDAPPVRTLGVVNVTGPRPTSLPANIPTTVEGATREQIARSVNATDSEDALKYFPSLLVRKRYIGDYNHAILSSRASVTGSSARSAVSDNSDVNGFTYMGVSSYVTADLRLRWKPARQWTVALGIDNLNDDKYWNFHPYPQRSYSAELKRDL